jgi:hypothetical protein
MIFVEKISSLIYNNTKKREYIIIDENAGKYDL